jgi:hypothetical protein
VEGPYTSWRKELEPKYRFKAETIVRFFERLNMTTEEKVQYLQQTFAGMEMYFSAHGNTEKS